MVKIKKVKGYISITEQDKSKSITENFKGQVIDTPIRFPKELGAEHPFSFEDMEKSFKKIGLVNGIINHTKNAIVGDFSIKVKNPNIQAFLDDFIHNTNFPSILREWIKEGLLKGNGFIEIDFINNKLRVLNANDMYVKRDKKGKIIEYNQWKGLNFRNIKKDIKKLVRFNPEQIAHLKINKISNEPYALGIIYPNERVIINQVKMEQSLEQLMERKAGMPIHIQIGEKGESVQAEDIDSMSNKLQFMHNKTEWVTDGNIEMKLIDFKGIEQSSINALEHNRENLATGVNIPVVSLGSGQLNEGIAKVQLENEQRFIKSIQEEIENIIEEQIFKPLLLNQKFPDVNAEGIDKDAIGGNERINFIWNLPGEAEINARIEKVNSLLANFNITENMKRMLQLELAKLLDLEDADKFLMEPEAGLDEQEKEKDDEFRDANLETKKQEPKPSNSAEAKKEKKIKQPEVPGAKPNANASVNLQEFVKKVGNKYCVISHRTGKSLGCYKTKKEAEKRLAQLRAHSKHNTTLINKKYMLGEGCGQQLTEAETSKMTIKEWCSLKEIEGFNYSDYLVRILRRLKVDKFVLLSALNEQQLADGLLGEQDINKLRIILKDGFRKNRTINEIETEIKNYINLKDRIKEGKVTTLAINRPNMIARSETTRIANQGLLDTYKDNRIKQVRFLAALSERTCSQCEALNGQVFEINAAEGIIPVHTNCRCSWLSVL